MKKKALKGLKITDESQGLVEAVIATLDVIDSDGDVTLKGAIDDGAPVRISAYNHQSWKGALPVGRGTVHEIGSEIVLKGEFFLTTSHGRDTFETVKGLGDLGEWSYGFDTLDEERGEKDGKRVNFLKKLVVHEASPVLLGAGVDTRTVAVKEWKQLNSDLACNLRDAGRERFGDDDVYVWMDDFDHDAGWAVYTVEAEDSVRHLRVSYERDENGAVTLAEQEEEVQRTTAYTPKVGAPRLTKQMGLAQADSTGAVDRFVDAVAQRAEDGRQVADSTLKQAKEWEASMASDLKRLREALAIEPRNAKEWREAQVRLGRATIATRKGQAA
jgi:prohead serine protease